MSWPERLSRPGPKRILAIDGGGVRGAVAIAFLEELERTLRVRYGQPDLVLSDYFDLIGGTSVGAILAAGLALGGTAENVTAGFKRMAPRLFRQYLPRIPLIQARFDPKRLGRLLEEQFGRQTLGDAAWKTGFAAVAKRVDTGSLWVLNNCPGGKYWNGSAGTGAGPGEPAGKAFVANSAYVLADVLHSSAAAPIYFDLVPIEVAQGERGVFFDGAMTPHGNPALQLAMTALIPAYGFNWSAGREKLLIVSIGTGGPRPVKPDWVARPMAAIWKALHALISIAYDTSELAVIVLQWLGESPRPWPINGELGDLRGSLPVGHKPLWTFMRYDAPLERAWLKRVLGVDIAARRIERLQRLDDEHLVEELYEIGKAAAKQQIQPDDFPLVFRPPSKAGRRRTQKPRSVASSVT